MSTLPGVTETPEIGATDGGGASAAVTVRRPLALSASRAADFRQCPLLYRLRAIDRLPEPRSRAQVLGVVVHSVLERLYGLDRSERSPERAVELVATEVERFYTEDDGASVVPPQSRQEVTGEASALVAALYGVEDPQRFSPAACEQYLVTATGAGTPLHGYLDRVDVAPDGRVRVVDYKTGRPPRPGYEDSALFQMKFYALMYARIHGVLPAQLKLIYLKDGSWLTLTPDDSVLDGTEQTLDALWSAIERAGRAGDFPPRTSRLCGWCRHKPRCPEFGGTPPPYPGWPGTRRVDSGATPARRDEDTRR